MHKNRITKQGNRFTENGFLVLFFFVCVRKVERQKNTMKNKGLQNKD